MGPGAAESIENQCRAAVRAELKGPNCRMANPRDNSLQVDPCGIPTTGSQMTLYTEKVVNRRSSVEPISFHDGDMAKKVFYAC
jgi:hypothetical protein